MRFSAMTRSLRLTLGPDSINSGWRVMLCVVVFRQVKDVAVAHWKSAGLLPGDVGSIPAGYTTEG
jgi:hypothetical protein